MLKFKFNKNFFNIGYKIIFPKIQIVSIIRNDNPINDKDDKYIFKILEINNSILLKQPTNKLFIYSPKQINFFNKKYILALDKTIEFYKKYYNIENIIFMGLIENKQIDAYHKMFINEKIKTEFLIIEKIRIETFFKLIGRNSFELCLDTENKLIFFKRKNIKMDIFKIIIWTILILINLIYIPIVNNILNY